MPRTYACSICGKKFNRYKLPKHVEKAHEESDLPEGITAYQFAYDIINNHPNHKGVCVVCGADCGWNERTQKYHRVCKNPKCAQTIKKTYRERMMKVYNKPHLMDDVNHLEKMLAHRKISGKYKWSDGTEFTYTGSYEKNFLEFLDKVMNYESREIISPGPVLEYDYKGKKHKWITDVMILPYNLIVEIKDGGDNKNGNQAWKGTREKTIAKEVMITNLGKYNYIRLTNNDFAQFLGIIAELKMQIVDDTVSPLYRIHEDTSLDEGLLIKAAQGLLRVIANSNPVTTKTPNKIKKITKKDLDKARKSIKYQEKYIEKEKKELQETYNSMKTGKPIYGKGYGKDKNRVVQYDVNFLWFRDILANLQKYPGVTEQSVTKLLHNQDCNYKEYIEEYLDLDDKDDKKVYEFFKNKQGVVIEENSHGLLFCKDNNKYYVYDNDYLEGLLEHEYSFKDVIKWCKEYYDDSEYNSYMDELENELEELKKKYKYYKTLPISEEFTEIEDDDLILDEAFAATKAAAGFIKDIAHIAIKGKQRENSSYKYDVKKIGTADRIYHLALLPFTAAMIPFGIGIDVLSGVYIVIKKIFDYKESKRMITQKDIDELGKVLERTKKEMKKEEKQYESIYKDIMNNKKIYIDKALPGLVSAYNIPENKLINQLDSGDWIVESLEEDLKGATQPHQNDLNFIKNYKGKKLGVITEKYSDTGVVYCYDTKEWFVYVMDANPALSKPLKYNEAYKELRKLLWSEHKDCKESLELMEKKYKEYKEKYSKQTIKEETLPEAIDNPYMLREAQEWESLTHMWSNAIDDIIGNVTNSPFEVNKGSYIDHDPETGKEVCVMRTIRPKAELKNREYKDRLKKQMYHLQQKINKAYNVHPSVMFIQYPIDNTNLTEGLIIGITKTSR